MEWSSRQLRPSIDIVSLTSTKMIFILLNADVATANSLRRIMLSEIPSLAIEVVTVLENTSVLHDEYIAHRLGLLPIESSSARNFEYRDKCTCSDKCSRCTVEYSLDVKCMDDTRVVTHYDINLDSWENSRGNVNAPMPVPRPSADALGNAPGDQGSDPQRVNSSGNATARNVQNPDGPHTGAVDRKSGSVPTGGIPIVKLKRGQCLSLKMTATKGLGKFHAKWMVANVAYKMEPVITINRQVAEKMNLNEKTQIVQSCPRKVFKLSNPHGAYSTATKAEIVIDNNLNCIYCDECLNQAREMGYRDLIRVQPDETKFHFTIESNGAISPEKILEICLDTLEEKLGSLHQHFLEAQARSIGAKVHTTSKSGVTTMGGSSGIDLD
ncbi:RNA polymerase Rpb3/RpoA insert domain family protein [Babesia bovis T2Bo]|uniref:DNA-directed RNA polymerase II, putative n=1 Tax=Babesia bovis TaxID=5865 RepID=A7AWB4_BABBO|nr:RNA polymerase Rpb3/RpoA insert domain family protein [Babesia bovis T2Bo]EDO05342.1 RNA polymerase Rpb3/RpoA insert domain family protein [Babesia bovis T2Bo]|eukprot:XP_001608910.1 DNA-directed RNA polymerase II [Babesia bovis T2Bo]